MQTTSTALPPRISLSQSTVYASQGSIYALEASSGTLRQQYVTRGLADPTVVNDVLYLNVSRHPDYLIQALRGDDGTSLWSYGVEGRLPSGAPVVVDGVVYTSVLEGTIYALQASDGTLLWRSSIDREPDVPSSLCPIIFTPPTVVQKTLYIAPAVDAPLKPFLYAFQTGDGTLLWKVPLNDSPSVPPIIVDGVIYLCTYSSCIALRESSGSFLWECKTKGWIRTSHAVVDGIICVSFSTLRHTFSETRWQVSHLWEPFICTLRANDGALLWQQQLGITTGASYPTDPVATHDTIFVGADDGYLYAFRTDDGTLLWSSKTNATLLSSPVVAQDILYVGGNDGYVYAFQATDGRLLWKTFVSVSVTVSASITTIPPKESEK